MLRISSVTALVGVLSFALPRGAPSIALSDFTVPAERLPNGCTLPVTSSERISGSRFRIGLWAGLPIPTNPWVGSDRVLIADIAGQMEEPSLLPDAPLLSARERARYHLKFADGIEEGYAAIYREGTLPELVTVYAVRVAGSARPDAFGNRRPSPKEERARVEIGQVVALVSGRGVCFEAVADYVASLIH